MTHVRAPLEPVGASVRIPSVLLVRRMLVGLKYADLEQHIDRGGR
jgi:hypothetical protein